MTTTKYYCKTYSTLEKYFKLYKKELVWCHVQNTIAKRNYRSKFINHSDNDNRKCFENMNARFVSLDL